MLLGICRGLNDFSSMKSGKEAGADYFETGFSCLANYSDEEFSDGKAMLDSLSLPCIASNGFIPGDMKVVGDDIDYGKLEDYLDRGFDRAVKLGVKKIIFGSGAARSFPEGYSKEKAREQFAFFLKEYAAKKAKKAGCIIVIEPLRFVETSMIHMVSEGVEMAKYCGCDNVFGLADLYHVYSNGDRPESIKDYPGFVRHCHIAEPTNRRYPSINDKEEIVKIYNSFFDSLISAGCDTCSIEARTDDFDADIFNAFKLLRQLIK